jgi:hypothetical protein
VDRASLQRDSGRNGVAAGRYGVVCDEADEIRSGVVEGGTAVHLAILSKDDTSLRLAESGRRLDQGIQHGLQIEGRATDRLEHVGGGSLLL